MAKGRFPFLLLPANKPANIAKQCSVSHGPHQAAGFAKSAWLRYVLSMSGQAREARKAFPRVPRGA